MQSAQLLTLKNELQTDPVAMGYAAYLPGNPVGCALLLNSMASPGVASIAVISLPKGSVILAIVPVLDQLATGITLAGAAIPQAIITKWQQRFQALQAATDPLYIAPLVPMFNQAVTDGLTTSAYVQAITHRNGSRTEVLFGAGITVTWQDVIASGA